MTPGAWIVGLIAIGCLVAMIVEAWRRDRPPGR
jgi:hypothetical protein